MSLAWKSNLAPGETVPVLVASCSAPGGGVGPAAVHLARLAGAGRVVECVRSDAALKRARRFGVDASGRLGRVLPARSVSTRSPGSRFWTAPTATSRSAPQVYAPHSRSAPARRSALCTPSTASSNSHGFMPRSTAKCPTSSRRTRCWTTPPPTRPLRSNVGSPRIRGYPCIWPRPARRGSTSSLVRRTGREEAPKRHPLTEEFVHSTPTSELGSRPGTPTRPLRLDQTADDVLDSIAATSPGLTNHDTPSGRRPIP